MQNKTDNQSIIEKNKNKEPIISARDLTFSYDKESGKNAVENVSFDIYEGEHIAILGHNGSGKSTLAKLLNLILVPNSGKLTVCGVELTDKDIDEDTLYSVRRQVGMVFQNPDNQLVATVVEEDVAFGPENLGVEPKEIRRRVDEALSAVGMLSYASASPHHLSGGQKQRVAVAGILAMEPRCIIFDESSAMLDPSGRREVTDVMKKMNKEKGITVINITHHMSEAVAADRVFIMDGARIREGKAPAEIFSDPKYLHGLGLEAPAETELLSLLADKGINISHRLCDTKECAERILAVLNGN